MATTEPRTVTYVPSELAHSKIKDICSKWTKDREQLVDVIEKQRNDYNNRETNFKKTIGNFRRDLNAIGSCIQDTRHKYQRVYESVDGLKQDWEFHSSGFNEFLKENIATLQNLPTELECPSCDAIKKELEKYNQNNKKNYETKGQDVNTVSVNKNGMDFVQTKSDQTDEMLQTNEIFTETTTARSIEEEIQTDKYLDISFYSNTSQKEAINPKHKNEIDDKYNDQNDNEKHETETVEENQSLEEKRNYFSQIMVMEQKLKEYEGKIDDLESQLKHKDQKIQEYNEEQPQNTPPQRIKELERDISSLSDENRKLKSELDEKSELVTKSKSELPEKESAFQYHVVPSNETNNLSITMLRCLKRKVKEEKEILKNARHHTKNDLINLKDYFQKSLGRISQHLYLVGNNDSQKWNDQISFEKHDERISHLQHRVEQQQKENEKLKHKIKEMEHETSNREQEKPEEDINSEDIERNKEDIDEDNDKELAELKFSFGEVSKNLENSRANEESLNQRVRELESEMENIQANSNKLDRESESRQKEKEDLSQQLKELSHEKKDIELALENSEKQVESVKNEKSKIESKLAASEKRMEQLRTDLDELSAEKARLEHKLKEAEEKLGQSNNKMEMEMTRLKQEMQRLKEERKENQEEMSEMNERLQNKEKELNSVKEQRDSIQEQLYEKEENLEQIENDFAKEQEISEQERQRADGVEKELKDEQQRNSQTKIELNKAQDEIEELRTIAKENSERKKEVAQIREKFNKEQLQRKKLFNIIEDMKGKIRVLARCRPAMQKEIERGDENVVKFPDELTVHVNNGEKDKEFVFDGVFGPESTQEKVFEPTRHLVQSAVDGYNVCIFAYGQTGSGKTYTIAGSPDNRGIAYRAMDEIFSLSEEQSATHDVNVKCYMVELYINDLRDMLVPPKQAAKQHLDIGMNEHNMIEVRGVNVVDISSREHLEQVYEEGQTHRQTRSTGMNDASSRSHLVFTILLEAKNKKTGNVAHGKLSLVDLAGSENSKKTNLNGGQGQREANAINNSLTTLSRVITALTAGDSYIPYRDNKLTHLMSDSIGGTAKTLMFVNIAPTSYNVEETLQALIYASKVKRVKNVAKKSVESKQVHALKNKLKRMQEKLKQQGVEDYDEDKQ